MSVPVWGCEPYTAHGLNWVSEYAFGLHRFADNIKEPCVAFGRIWRYVCTLARCECGTCGEKIRCSVALYDSRGNPIDAQLVFTCQPDEAVTARSWALTVASLWNADLKIVDVMGEDGTITLEDNRAGLTGLNK
jgi:hypothetical protein